ncbi:uncharacterized protein LTR77_003235 [Saxophila tyrrhenica]|uniref:Uncharacterized protein n=1 Tax=Saxophila tyrrhenica TaxID=1690608 RepID=A0AAV9PIL1_9PEZI|nr:hypothetical protein LTR77_003235 [Saxophila tyrrhenica]
MAPPPVLTELQRQRLHALTNAENSMNAVENQIRILESRGFNNQNLTAQMHTYVDWLPKLNWCGGRLEAVTPTEQLAQQVIPNDSYGNYDARWVLYINNVYAKQSRVRQMLNAAKYMLSNWFDEELDSNARQVVRAMIATRSGQTLN